MWVPFLRSFSGNEVHKLFLRAPNMRCSGPMKVMLTKFLCWFPSPKKVKCFQGLAGELKRVKKETSSQARKKSTNKNVYPLRRNDYQNNSKKIFLCNCPGAITGFSCRVPENNSPNYFSCKSPCPVRAPPSPCKSPQGTPSPQEPCRGSGSLPDSTPHPQA